MAARRSLKRTCYCWMLPSGQTPPKKNSGMHDSVFDEMPPPLLELNQQHDPPTGSSDITLGAPSTVNWGQSRFEVSKSSEQPGS